MNLNEFLNTVLVSDIQTPVLVIGNTGIGKTDQIRQICKALGRPLVEPPAVSTLAPEDIGGIPVPMTADGKLLNGHEVDGDIVTRWAPPSWWADLKALEGQKPVLFLDELNRASTAVQNALFPVLFGNPRRAGNLELPEDMVIISAANPPSHMVNDIGPALLARFIVYHYSPTAQDWVEWAAGAAIHPDIMGFINENPNMLAPDPGSAAGMEALSELKPFPCPRAWEFSSSLLRTVDKANSSNVLASTLLMSAIGENAANTFVAWRSSLKGLPTPVEMLNGAKALPVEPARAIVSAARCVDYVMSHESLTESLFVNLLKIASDWPSELVVLLAKRLKHDGDLPKRLEVEAGNSTWMVTLLQKAPDMVKNHGTVFKLIMGRSDIAL
jgi:hypothetical protein